MAVTGATKLSGRDPVTVQDVLDLVGGGGGLNIPPGVNGQLLMFDSGTAGNIIWATVPGAVSPLTTNGDIYYRAGGVDTRLGVGANGALLTVVGGLPAWSTATMETLGAMTDTWSDGGVDYIGLGLDVTRVAAGSGSRLLRFRVGGAVKAYVDAEGGFWSNSGVGVGTGASIEGGEIRVRQDNCFAFSNTSSYSVAAAKDTSLWRTAAGVVGIRGASISTGGAISLLEMAAAPAAVANQAILYCEDNGSGKTRLMVRMPTGASIQLAIELP